MGTDQQIEGQRRELARSLDYLTSAELRMLAGITEKTEEAWRKRHIGPAYVVVLNPADWLVVTTATGTDGHYLGGSYRCRWRCAACACRCRRASTPVKHC